MAALCQIIPNSMNILYFYLKELGKGNTYKYLTHKNLLMVSNEMNSFGFRLPRRKCFSLQQR